MPLSPSPSPSPFLSPSLSLTHTHTQLSGLEQYEGRLKKEYEVQLKTKSETLSAGKSKPDVCLL